MGIRLTIDRSPRRVALPGGAWLMMRPANSIEIAAAESEAKRRLADAIAGIRALADIGIPPIGPEDLTSEHYLEGVTRHLGASLLAPRLVTGWGGVFDPEGIEIAFDPEHLPALLLQVDCLRRFERAAFAAREVIVAEGKGSPLSPNGSPAGEGATARAAASRATPAPAAAPASTGRAARRSSTGRKPRKD